MEYHTKGMAAMAAAPPSGPATLIAWFIGFGFRLAALRFKWEEPEPWAQEQMKPGEAPAATGR
jgi:hypothetical protein